MTTEQLPPELAAYEDADDAEARRGGLGGGIESMTISGGGRSVTITPESAKRMTENIEKLLGKGKGSAKTAPSAGEPRESTRDHIPYPVPSEASLNGEFTPAPDLEEIARALIRQHSHQVAAECQIAYLWKDKGGASKGKLTLGKCSKPSGLLRHFSEVDFVIWLAADHARNTGMTYLQVTAALWHELGHVGETEDEEGDNPPTLVVLPHDLEMFHSEYKLFGAWKDDLRAAEHTFRQLPLDLKGGE